MYIHICSLIHPKFILSSARFMNKTCILKVERDDYLFCLHLEHIA